MRHISLIRHTIHIKHKHLLLEAMGKSHKFFLFLFHMGGVSILPKDTCGSGESNQQPSDNKTLALPLGSTPEPPALLVKRSHNFFFSNMTPSCCKLSAMQFDVIICNMQCISEKLPASIKGIPSGAFHF